MRTPILHIDNLAISFGKGSKRQTAVNGVHIDLYPGETVGLVGESGSGKSVTALSILNLISHGGGSLTADAMRFQGTDLLSLTASQWRQIRGRKISMIFQEPMTSLNPVFSVGDQIAEVFRTHLHLSHAEARDKTIEMLKIVRIPAPEKRVDEYPHQLSGGMRQRVMIAMALACKPELLIADEPTTALDVTIQAQIMNLIGDLQQSLGMSVLLITHDLSMVAETCDRVIVMYGGRIVETAPTEILFSNPSHPYTIALLAATPKLGARADRLTVIPGNVPSLGAFPSGCRFRSRCSKAMPMCADVEPDLLPLSPEHSVACFLREGGRRRDS